MDATRQPVGRARRRLDAPGIGIHCAVRREDPRHGLVIERRQSCGRAITDDAPQRAGELRCRVRTRYEDRQTRPAVADAFESIDRFGCLLGCGIEVVEDQERGTSAVGHPVDGRTECQGIPRGARVGDRAAVRGRDARDLGGQARPTDAIGADDRPNDDGSATPGAPRPPEGAGFAVSTKDRSDRVELGRNLDRRGPVRDLSGGGRDGREVDLERIDDRSEPLELEARAGPDVEAVGRARKVHDARAREDLAGAGGRAQSRGHVERGPAIALLDRHGLTRVEPDPDPERRRWMARDLVGEDPLELDGRPERAARRTQDRQRFVAPELDDRAAGRLDAFADDLGERAGESSRGLVAGGARVRRVPADVGDEEGEDRAGRAGWSRSPNAHGVVPSLARAKRARARSVHADSARPALPPQGDSWLSQGPCGARGTVGQCRASPGHSARPHGPLPNERTTSCSPRQLAAIAP